MTDDKRAANGFKQEKWMIEKFKEKILVNSEVVTYSQSTQCTITLLISSSNNSRKLSKNVLSGVKTYYITKHKLNNGVFVCSAGWKFQEIPEQPLLLQTMKKLNGLENMTKHKLFDLRFLFPDVKGTELQLAWNSLEKIKSLKITVTFLDIFQNGLFE